MSYALSRRAAVAAPRSGGAVRAVVLAAIALNVIGFAVYKKLHKPEDPEALAVVTTRPAEVKVEPLPGKKKASVEVPGSKAREDLVRALRASGLAALEGGDYPAAVKSFTQVLKLSGNEGDAAELLRIAKELQDRAKEAQKRAAQPALAEAEPVAQPEAKRVAEPVRAKPTPKPQPKAQPKRVAAASRAEPEEEPEPEQGILLVTSSPPGLVVEVDGRSVDLTPAKVRLEPGSHSVVLLRGNLRLHERKVEVSAEGVHTVDVDLTGALRVANAFAREPSDEADEPRDHLNAAPQAAPAVAPAPAQVARASTTAAPPAATTATARAPAPAPSSGPGAVGDLHVVSPSIFGDVWINGRAYGPAPVLAKRVAAGEAVVEIRVGGVARRTKTIDVVPNQRTTLRIR